MIRSSLAIGPLPSLIDGAEIYVIFTGRPARGQRGSDNPKTGALIQSWIIRADLLPRRAIESGADASVCGSCRLRPTVARALRADARARREPATATQCYVRVDNAPRAVYRALQAGRYARADTLADAAEWLRGFDVRLGSYGDPAAVSVATWRAILRHARLATGYSHQWDHPDPIVRANARAIRQWCMASVDSAVERDRAQAAGWRTFRVIDIRRADEAKRASGEAACPAARETGARLDCASCRQCAGTSAAGPRGIAIFDHGLGAAARRLSDDQLRGLARRSGR
jgi:hypothetical protein